MYVHCTERKKSSLLDCANDYYHDVDDIIGDSFLYLIATPQPIVKNFCPQSHKII